MKKVILALAVIASVTCFTSCDKTCHCKVYLNGEIQAERDQELDDESDITCADLNTVVIRNHKKTGLECR